LIDGDQYKNFIILLFYIFLRVGLAPNSTDKGIGHLVQKMKKGEEWLLDWIICLKKDFFNT